MIKLALVFLKIGAASYGGGWTIVGIIRNEVISQGWLTADEFIQLVAIAQITPGPLALNTATLVGFNLYGFAGAVLATLCVMTVPIIASVILSLILSKMSPGKSRFSEALKTGTIGLVLMTAWTFLPQMTVSWTNAILATTAFFLVAFTKINPVWMILAAGFGVMMSRSIFV